jgi:O-antigen/teichoic acid export membrane protein
MYGAMAGVGIIQGTNILLSIFFGPVTVACYAIANQIYNAMNSLCSSVVLAFRPAMVKSYAECNHDYLKQLFYVSNKFILYLLAAIILPLIFEMPTILSWWLDNASEDTVLFSRLMLIMMVILAMNNPITIIIQSTGRVRQYYLLVDTMTLCCVPITWLLFKLGLPAYGAFLTMIGVCIVAHAIRLYCLRTTYSHFQLREYFHSLLLPALMIIAMSAIGTLFIHSSITSQGLRFLCVMVASPLMLLLLVYLIGISKQEKLFLTTFVKQFIK